MTSSSTPPAREHASLVLTGGTVLTLDARDTEATALAARDGRILYVGDDAGAAAHVGDDTTVIDLAGRTVIPGINESHMHASWMGSVWPFTLMGAMAEMAERGEATPEGEPPAGPKPLTTSAERRAAILRAHDVAASLGITSYTEPGLGPGEDEHGETGACGSDSLEQYRLLAREGRLKARVNVLMLFGLVDGPSTIDDFEAGVGTVGQGQNDPAWLRIAGVKIFADGIPPMHTAWINGEYRDGTSGDLLIVGDDIAQKEERMRRMIRLAHERGLQVGIHATGDRSIDVFADEVAALGGARDDLRHYVIHGDMASDAALERMASVGMGVNIQAGLTVATNGMMRAAFPEEVVEATWPIVSALRLGTPLCLSSDAPVLSPDWREGVAAAAAWVGDALGGPRETMLALLRAYTVTPAWQDHAEGWKGTLEPGKVADLAVLERNPLETAPGDLPNVGVDLTVVDGRIVFDRAESPEPAPA